MRHQLTKEQIESYQSAGFVVIDNFLSEEELEHWRKGVSMAVEKRAGIKIPGKEIRIGEADGINEDAASARGLAVLPSTVCHKGDPGRPRALWKDVNMNSVGLFTFLSGCFSQGGNNISSQFCLSQ